MSNTQTNKTAFQFTDDAQSAAAKIPAQITPAAAPAECAAQISSAKNESIHKIIHVAAAIMFRTKADGTKELFAAQRGCGKWKGWWEFPGGKIEDGESAEQAVIREIREELSVTISVERRLCSVEYDYPEFHLKMECFLCTIISGKLTLLEHKNSAWLAQSDLASVRWLPADRKIIAELAELLQLRNRLPQSV